MGDTADLVRSERIALIDLLETLTPDEWAVPSLCDAWTVQEVAAHLAWAPVEPLRRAMPELVRHRFRLNAMNADLAVRWSQRGTAAILQQLRRNAAEGARPVGVPDAAVIADAVIHGLDIRRPLGRSRPIPNAAFVTLAEFFLDLRWPLSVSVGGSARKRVHGLRLVASDADWSHGTGPEVRTSSEALLLVLSGRPVDAAELSGTGAVELSHRL
jgi:uncharacterized protein (TIGR03083 family)